MPVAGRFADRADVGRPLALAGLVSMACGTLFYTQLEPDTGLAPLAGALFVAGLGHGMVFVALQTVAYGRLDRDEVASGTTVGNIIVRVGMSFGTAALAVVLQTYLVASFPGTKGNLAEVSRLTGDPAHRELLAHAFGDSLWWSFGAAILAMVPVLLLPNRQPNRPEM
jgi:MFS family permease